MGYITGAVVTALLALWLAFERIDTLKADKANLTLQLRGCQARTTNMNEDKESDDAIDVFTDDDLRNAPPEWMLDPGAVGVN